MNFYYTMYRPLNVLAISLTLFLFSCTPTVKPFYHGTFFPEDNIYRNTSLRFLMSFRGNWDIVTDPNHMSRSNRDFALELQKSGIDLLFVGSTVEGLHGTRAIAANYNKPALEYALSIQELNIGYIQNDRGFTDLTDEIELVRWIYEKSGFTFTEYFVAIDTYNIRFAFWTTPDLFERFLPVYEGIIGTLQLY